MAKNTGLSRTPTVISIAQDKGVMQTLLNGGFLVAVAGGAYLLIKKVANTINRNSALNDFGKNTNDGIAVQFASQFYSAMISAEWLSDYFGDGTNEALVFSTARQMNQYKIALSDVARQYKNLYNRDLLQDLQKELSASDWAKFQTALNSGLAGLGKIQKLITTAPGQVLNEKFLPIQPIMPGINLGEHQESIVFADGRIFHGFMHLGKQRYVASTISKIL